MNKKLFLIALKVIFSIGLYAQNLSVAVNYVTSEATSNSNTIYYKPGELLNWDDFKGKPVTGSDAAALTSAGFGLKLAFRRVENTSQLLISVSCSFSKKDSWVLPGNKTNYILNHEQKHFDIAYTYTLLFIQNLKSSHFTNANYNAVIEKAYNETAVAMGKIQDQYDKETSHSRIPGRQAEWDQKISQQMESALKNKGNE